MKYKIKWRSFSHWMPWENSLCNKVYLACQTSIKCTSGLIYKCMIKIYFFVVVVFQPLLNTRTDVTRLCDTEHENESEITTQDIYMLSPELKDMPHILMTRVLFVVFPVEAEGCVIYCNIRFNILSVACSLFLTHRSGKLHAQMTTYWFITL